MNLVTCTGSVLVTALGNDLREASARVVLYIFGPADYTDLIQGRKRKGANALITSRANGDRIYRIKFGFKFKGEGWAAGAGLQPDLTGSCP